ncbi:MAG: hypothetical protein GY810_28925 [Aureispira sp.]|nr:hypothetical protein [Aureispira sp.]
MNKSKLVQLFKVFDRQEKELLRKWMESPAHNVNGNVDKLFEYLFSRRKLTPVSTSRYKAFVYVFGQVEYDDPKMKHLMNISVFILEDFIGFLKYKKSSFFQKKALISFCREHKLEKYAKQYIDKTQKTQKKQVIQNSKYYLHQYELEEEVFEQEGTSIRRENTNLQAIFDNHYIVFMLETLRHACTAITHQNLYKLNYKIPLLEQVLLDAKQEEYLKIPALQMYYHSYMALVNSEEGVHFEELKKLLLFNKQILPPTEIKSIYIIAINYCVKRLNTGAEEYVRAVFELYQYGLANDILVNEEGELSRFAYKNIATIAIRLEEFEWSQQFMEAYTGLLKKEHQKNYRRYAQVKLFFAQKNYDKCLEELAQVEFDDLFLNIGAKTMLLKIYYEQEHFDALESLLVSFQRFLQRKTMIAYQQKIYSNMLLLVDKLMKLAYFDKKEIEVLRAEIETTNPLTERPWLLAQLDKLQ